MNATEIKHVGVVGCGIMGRGIAEVTACAGYKVTVNDINREIVDNGIKAIETSLEMAVRRQKLDKATRDAALGRIAGTCTLDDFI